MCVHRDEKAVGEWEGLMTPDEEGRCSQLACVGEATGSCFNHAVSQTDSAVGLFFGPVAVSVQEMQSEQTILGPPVLVVL